VLRLEYEGALRIPLSLAANSSGQERRSLDKLEERIGSKGREIFENFVREINRLAGRRDWSKEVDRKR
jgi:hypothetical protein